MTGTAATEVAEFNNIYDLNVAVVPSNKARMRVATPAANLACLLYAKSINLYACKPTAN